MKKMVTFDEALNLVLNEVPIMDEETAKLENTLFRVASRDIISKINIPPFDNSAMDGYAIRSRDIKSASKESPVVLNIIEHIRAGQVPNLKVDQSHASRIMTGAQIPEGADVVIMQEMTRKHDDKVVIFKNIPAGTNIRKAGEDIGKGNICIQKGKVIAPADMGLIGAIGYEQVYVYKRPVVAILATGDELIPPGEPIQQGKIRDANTYSLTGQILCSGGVPLSLGIAGDNAKRIKEKLLSGMDRADIIITSGGVSVGDYDEVQNVFKELGIALIFWKTQMKPGKPLLFGKFKGKPVFGVPGNTASSMVVFDELIKPSLLKMSGRKKFFLPVIEAFLREELRSQGDRLTFIRVIVRYSKACFDVYSAGSQSSGVLSSMAAANGLVGIPKGEKIIKKDQMVKVQILDWSFLSKDESFC